VRRRTLGLLSSLPLIVGLATAEDAVVEIQTDRALAKVDERYLSVAIDLANVVGGKWWDESASSEQGRGSGEAQPLDLTQPRLLTLAKALSPAVLRIGGSEADFLYYDIANRGGAAPEGYESVLSGERWNELYAFSQAVDMDLMFTLNAGPADRDDRKRWQPDHARSLMEHAQKQGHRVLAWELGNEVNGFAFFHGLRSRVSGRRYAKDYARAQGLARELYPQARVAGPASAYWPILGEPLAFLFGVMKPFLERTERADVITWHYYPTQSDRCPIRVRKATLERMLAPKTLNEIRRWAKALNTRRDEHQPDAEIWLGESGPAQCGGQRGLSDTFASGFWFLDQLGSVARFGHTVHVRQSLIGADYGLLTEDEARPNPDFYNALLWKRLMGTQVLDAQVEGSESLRAYAHSTPGRRGGVTVLLLNVSQEDELSVELEGDLGGTAEHYAVSAREALSKELLLNGAPLRLGARDALPALTPVSQPREGKLTLPPLTYRFVVFPDAGFGKGLAERLR